MNEKYLHIVMHDVPYPADFGGVIDLFYKLKYLHAAGAKIKLHCFTGKRKPQEELAKYCHTVQYYKRKGLPAISLKIPFIVNSRRDKELIANLQKDNLPILLEGVHCTYYLYKKQLVNRQVFIRLHNVEYRYYEQLAKNERSIFKRTYYDIEARLLKKYEAAIAKTAKILTVSSADKQIYTNEFQADDITFIPVFLPYQRVNSIVGLGSFCLYHGNLSINENNSAAVWLIKNIFSSLKIPLVIAGKNPSTSLKQLAKTNKFISIVENPSEEDMQLLVSHAQVNILPSFNNTGVKLKLLNALYNGRHCLVNKAGTEGSDLNELCNIADLEKSFIETVQLLFTKTFDQKEIHQRSTVLNNIYNNEKNAEIIMSMLQ